MILADPTGRIIAADSEAALSINVDDRNYFLRAMKGEANFSKALISRQTGNVIVVRADPVRRDENVVGVLAVMTPTLKLTQMLEEMWTGVTTDIYLLNEDGILVTRPRFADKMQQAGRFENRPELEAKIETEGVQAVLEGRESDVTRSIENIASVSEENSAAVEEVSASAGEMSAQVEEVTASAQSLAEMAESLQRLVGQFRLVDHMEITVEKLAARQTPQFTSRASAVWDASMSTGLVNIDQQHKQLIQCSKGELIAPGNGTGRSPVKA